MAWGCGDGCGPAAGRAGASLRAMAGVRCWGCGFGGEAFGRALNRNSLKSNGPEFESHPSQRFNSLSMEFAAAAAFPMRPTPHAECRDKSRKKLADGATCKQCFA